MMILVGSRESLDALLRHWRERVSNCSVGWMDGWMDTWEVDTHPLENVKAVIQWLRERELRGSRWNISMAVSIAVRSIRNALPMLHRNHHAAIARAHTSQRHLINRMRPKRPAAAVHVKEQRKHLVHIHTFGPVDQDVDASSIANNHILMSGVDVVFEGRNVVRERGRETGPDGAELVKGEAPELLELVPEGRSEGRVLGVVAGGGEWDGCWAARHCDGLVFGEQIACWPYCLDIDRWRGV